MSDAEVSDAIPESPCAETGTHIPSSPFDTLSGGDPEWFADLARAVRLVGTHARGTTNLNGQLVSFGQILEIAARQVERLGQPGAGR